jgi:hypothetical protein
MKGGRIFVWSVAWRFPYKTPPDGFPLVMLRVEQLRPPGADAGACPPEIHECWEGMWGMAAVSSVVCSIADSSVRRFYV